MAQKLTFDDALQMLSDEHYVEAADVQSRALTRKVWLAEWHLPGCLSESRSYCLTKADAIEACLSMASGKDGPPRGMATDLRVYGRSDRNAPDAWARGAISTVSQYTLADFF